MTDELEHFEQDVSRMLASRAAVIPEHYDAASELVARARRRRATKVTGLTVLLLVVATGTTAAVAAVARPDPTERLATAVSTPTNGTTTTSATVLPPSAVTATTAPIVPATVPTTTVAVPGPRVATVRCPVIDANGSAPQPAPPSTDPRAPAAGNPAPFADLVSFAATTDPRFTVLGPRSWSCETSFDGDGRRTVVLFAPTPTNTIPGEGAAPIAIDDDWLWHGAATTACALFDDPAVVQNVTRLEPRDLPCPQAGRVVTRIDTHVATFVDANGNRGVGWLVLPSSPEGADGEIVVLTCRPTSGLTAAECDAIVADYAARARDQFGGGTVRP